jgi:hypothetical protein
LQGATAQDQIKTRKSLPIPNHINTILGLAKMDRGYFFKRKEVKQSLLMAEESLSY